MKYFSLFVVFLLFTILACGCTENSPPLTPEPVPDTTQPVAPLENTTPTLQQKTLLDPFAGTWECKSYLASGPLRKVYTFMENGSWTRTNTNLDSMVQAFSHGTWKKESEGNYVIHSSVSGGTASFEYDKGKDTLYEPHFKETFHRVSEEYLLKIRIPTLAISVTSSQQSSKIQGMTPNPGKVFLLVNLSIENTNEPGGFSFENRNIQAVCDETSAGGAITQKLADRIENPLSPGNLALGEVVEGNVVLGIPEGTVVSRIRIVNNEGDTVSNIVELQNVPRVEL